MTKRILLALGAVASAAAIDAATELTMIVGTYTGSGSHGVYSYRFNTRTGIATVLDSVAVENPSYVVISLDRKNIYTVGENGNDNSKVNALSLDKRTGRMTLLNSVDSHGGDPCHIMQVTSRTLAVANYSGGSLALFNINPDGTVSNCTQVHQLEAHGDSPRQASSHIHFSAVTPDKNHVVASNLAGDCIYLFKIEKNKDDGTATLQLQDSVNVNNGAGPRHLEFSPDGKKFYLLTELSDEVMAFNYHDGHISHYQTILAAQEPAHASGDIHIDPKEGQFLYASVRRNNDGIAIFKVDNNGLLKKTGYQKTGLHPRNFAITPDGKLLLCACRDSNVIQVYAIDRKTGLLTNLHQDIPLNKPVCIKFL